MEFNDCKISSFKEKITIQLSDDKDKILSQSNTCKVSQIKRSRLQQQDKNDDIFTSIIDKQQKESNFKNNGDLNQDENVQLNSISNKLDEIVKRLKLRQAASNLINSTRSRMLKNMKPHQYAFINDKAQNFSDFKKNQKAESHLQKKDLISREFQIFKTVIKNIPVLNPSSNRKYLWDFFVCLVLLYSFFVIPAMISFGLAEEQISHKNILDFILIVNLCDIFVTCNTGFYKRGVFCKNRSSIWRKYYYEQMKLDFVSLLPILIFRLLSLKFINYQYYQFIMLSILIKWKAIMRLYNNIQQKYILMPNTRNILSLMNLFFKILLIAHGCACVWVFSGRVSMKYYDDNNWFKFKKIEDVSWERQYLSAFYFCTVTMTTVGYGDIVPQSPVEMLVCIVILLFACGVFGFSVNTISDILQNFSQNEREIMDKMFIIKSYLSKKSINPSLSKDVTEYLEYFWRANQTINVDEQDRMLKQLPDSLRNELLIESNKLVLRDSMIFQNNFSEDVIKDTISIIQEKNYTPDEVIYTESDEATDRSIYFIQEGIVEIYIDITNNLSSNQVLNQRQFKTIKRLKKGDCFGEMEFFTDGNRTMNVRSINFSTLLKIDRNDFVKAIAKYPQDYEQFCYMKDKLIMQHDFSKINHKCLSCKSESHTLECCPYLHYNANKPKIFALLNQSQNQLRNEKPIELQQLRLRQRYRLLPIQVAEVVNVILTTSEDFIEEYNTKYLSFDISKCDVCTNILNINQPNLQYFNINSCMPNQEQNQYYFNANGNQHAQRTQISPNQKNMPYSSYFTSNNINNNNNNNNNNNSNYSNYNNNNSNSFNDDFQQKANQFRKNYGKGHSISILEEIDDPDSNSPRVTKLQPITLQNLQKQSKRIIEPPESNQSQMISMPNQFSYTNSINNMQVIQENDKIEDDIMRQKNGYQINQNNQNSNYGSIRQEQSNKYLKKISHLTSLPELMNIQNQQNNVYNFHIRRLFFDVFYGQFEKMHFFELYYPLNNYSFVIKQIHMNTDQKKLMKDKLLEQQRQNINKIMVKKKKKNGPRGSINQNTVDHSAIKHLVDKFEQEGRKAQSRKESTIGLTLQAMNTNIYINNPSYQGNSAVISPNSNIKSKKDSNSSQFIAAKTHNTYQKSNFQGSDDCEDTHKNIKKIMKNDQANYLQKQINNESLGNSAVESQSSDLFGTIDPNNSLPMYQINQEANEYKEKLDNDMGLNLSINSVNNRPILINSLKKIFKKDTTELEKFMELESKLSTPSKERTIQNYEHSEIPDIKICIYNSRLEELSKK